MLIDRQTTQEDYVTWWRACTRVPSSFLVGEDIGMRKGREKNSLPISTWLYGEWAKSINKRAFQRELEEPASASEIREKQFPFFLSSPLAPRHFRSSLRGTLSWRTTYSCSLRRNRRVSPSKEITILLSNTYRSTTSRVFCYVSCAKSWLEIPLRGSK